MSINRNYLYLAGGILLVAIIIMWVWHKRDVIVAATAAERAARMQLGMSQPEPPVSWTPTAVTPPPVTVPTTVDPPPLPAASPNRPAVRTWKCDVHSGYCP